MGGKIYVVGGFGGEREQETNGCVGTKRRISASKQSIWSADGVVRWQQEEVGLASSLDRRVGGRRSHAYAHQPHRVMRRPIRPPRIASCHLDVVILQRE
jgi:hypothetical protein